MSTVNDVMEDEEQGRQVMLVDGKPMLIRDILEKIKKKNKDKTEREFSEG